MNNYQEFDKNMRELKLIERELKALSEQDDVSLEKAMGLREKAKSNYKVCANVLKEIKDVPSNNE